MILLMLFALLAGAGTALSPCVLPVLPAVLGAGVTGGRRRPLGVVTGIVVSFTFATVALVYVIDALGLPDDLVRSLAIVTLGRLRRRPARSRRSPTGSRHSVSRIAPGPARVARRGVRLGLRCSGQPRPRLRAVRRADPGRRDHGLGLAGLHRRQARGRARLRDRLGRRALRADARRPQAASTGCGRGAAQIQMAMGALMVATAVAMAADLDIASRPRSPTTSRRSSSTRPASSRSRGAVADELAEVRGGGDGAEEGGGGRGGGGRRAAALRRGPGLHRHAGVVQHRTASRSRSRADGRAGPGRPDRLLDLHLHQLHPHAALPEGLGRGVPRRRADDRRRPHAGVRVREGGAGNVADAIADNEIGTRSCRTTSSAPGPRSATSTGRRST